LSIAFYLKKPILIIMNLSRIKDIFPFLPFWHLSPHLLASLSHGQCGQEDGKKSAQKLKKSNNTFNLV